MIVALGLLPIACKPAAPSATCTISSSAAPASIGGAAAIASLTPVLAGPDRENSIDEAIRRFRTLDPTISDDQMIDIMIAADCPNGGTDMERRRSRAKRLRAEVGALLAQ